MADTSEWEDVEYGPPLPSSDDEWEDVEYGDPLPSAREPSIIPEPQSNEVNSYSGVDRLIGALKGIGKSSMGVITKPADLLYRAGNAGLNELADTGLGRAMGMEQVSPQGGYPSDYANQAFEWLSDSKDIGSPTAEKVAGTMADIGWTLAVPSQAGNIAKQLPTIQKVSPTLAKIFGLGTEGAAYSLLGNPQTEDPLFDATLGAGLNVGLYGLGKGLGKGLEYLNADKSALNMAKNTAEEFRKVVPDSFTSAKGIDERAIEAINALESKGQVERKAAGQLFKDLPNEPIILDDAIKNIQQIAEAASGPISPGSRTSNLINILSNLKPKDEMISTPAGKVLDEFGKPAIQATEELIKGGPAVLPLNKVQDTLRDIGRLQQGAEGVDSFILKSAKDEILNAARSKASPKNLAALENARSAWAKMSQAYDEGAVGTVRDALKDASGKLNTFKNQLLNDPKSTEQLIAVMAPKEIENAQNIAISELVRMSPVSWEKEITKRLPSYKLIFGDDGAERILTMVTRKGTVGKKLLADNHGLSKLISKYPVIRPALGAAGAFKTAGLNIPIMFAASYLSSRIPTPGEKAILAKSLLMRAAAGSADALRELNAPLKSSKYPEALGRIGAVLTASLRQESSLAPLPASSQTVESEDQQVSQVSPLVRENQLAGIQGDRQPSIPQEVSTPTMPQSQITPQLPSSSPPIKPTFSNTKTDSKVNKQLSSQTFPDIRKTLKKDVESKQQDMADRQIQVESGGNPNAIGPQTKYGRPKGIAQFLDSTGQEMAEKAGVQYNPFNPEQQLQLRDAYMTELNDMFGDEKLAYAAYNFGMGNVFRLMRQTGAKTFEELYPYLPSETQNYVKQITGVGVG